MKDVPENELFSAYLDGELTAAEQAQVEQLLAASPGARQLVDELRALSATLQLLPVCKLSEDLGPQILRQAERRILTGPAVAVGSGLNEAEPVAFSLQTESPTPVWRMIAGRLARPRIWVWPAAAVAVAIMLAIFVPESRQRVAHEPAEKSMASAAVSNVPVSSEPLSMREADRFAVGPASAPRPMKEAAIPEMIVAKPVWEVSGEKAAATTRLKEDERPRPTAQPGMTPASPAPAVPVPAASPMTVAKQPGPSPRLLTSSEERKPEEREEEKAEKPGEPSSRPMKGAKQGPTGAIQTVEKGIDGAMAREEMWIVACDVTAEAIGEDLLNQVLAKRHVVRTEPAGKDVGQLNRVATLSAAPRPMEAKALSRRGGEGGSRDKAKGDSAKLVYVHAEVTSADLQAVLADLKARPQMVASVWGATARVEFASVQFGGAAAFGRASSPMKQANRDADQSAPKDAKDLKGAKQAPADSRIMQFQVGASPGMPGAAGAGVDRSQSRQSRSAGTVAGGGAMSGQAKRQMDRTDSLQESSRVQPPGMAGGQAATQMWQAGGAFRSQTAIGDGTLSAQQLAVVEQAYGAGQQFVPPVRLNIVGPLPVDQPAVQLPVKRRVVFVLRVVDAGGIAAEAGQSSKAPAAGAESAGSERAKSGPAKTAAPAEPVPSAKPTQEAPK